MRIHEKGYWLDEHIPEHIFDPKLCSGIIEFLQNNNAKTLVDFGCGHGKYTKTIGDAGIETDGFDGNPETPKMTDGLCKVFDLTTEYTGKKYDWAMSLEVAEHIPKEYESQFISNLHNANHCGIIITWATKGQGGHGHINEQPNEYVLQKFHELGYSYDAIESEKLRTNSTLWWFKNTVMVFKR